MKEAKKKQKDKLSNFDQVTSLIKNSTNENLRSVVVPLELFEYTGETQKAVFLARLLYLSDKGKKPNGFIWKTYDDWEKEIGLTKSQIERIVKYFKQKGLIEAEKMMAASKNCNASNTWHYKLNMNNFLTDFSEFLAVGTKKNLTVEQQETNGSITESTFINTANITTLSKNKKEKNLRYKEKTGEEANQHSSNPVTSSSIGSDNGLEDEDGAPQVSLPDNFEPQLSNQVWAMNTFPRKSLNDITKSVVSYYQKNKHVKRDLDGWQNEWRKFVKTERVFGTDNELIEQEHDEIKNNLLDLVYNVFNRYKFDFLPSKSPLFLIPPKVLHFNFCEKDNFVWENIYEILEYLVKTKYLGKYFDWYYDIKKYDEFPEFATRVNDHMRKYCKNIDGCKLIVAFMREKFIVTAQDIIEKFPDISKDSINNFLRVHYESDEFSLTGEYYHRNRQRLLGSGSEAAEYEFAIEDALIEKGLIIPEECFDDENEFVDAEDI